MSAVVTNDELLAAIRGGDVRAVDQALQSGVSPDAEFVEEEEEEYDDNGYVLERYSPLLYLATKVHWLECICVARSFLPF